MVTTVTDNSPQSINTSLFSLDKEVQEIKTLTDSFNDKISGISPKANVISVNGKQGIVTINAQDVHALPDTTVIPTTTGELTNNSGFITIEDVGASYVPLTRTVNGKALSSDINLTASDVGALPDTTTIPTKTSQLTNDSGFVTSNGFPLMASFSRSVPVTSWTDIITPSDVNSGSYLFVIYVNDNTQWWSEYASFVMFYYAGNTNDAHSTPIYFNQSGHAPNQATMSLRYQRRYGSDGGYGSIQIYFSGGASVIPISVLVYKIAG